MAEKVARRGVSIFIDGSSVQNSVTAIKREYQKLIREQGRMEMGSKEYIAQTRKIAQLGKILKDHKDYQTEITKQYSEMGDAANEFEKKSKKAFSLDSIANNLSKLKTLFGGLIASFTVDKIIDEYAKLDDAQANVIKYTGLTKEEIKTLNKEFDSLDTRTSRVRLNELASEAGRLGIQSKKDILEFVDAANIIDVALGEDLGEGAIKSIGKLAEMFGDADRMGLKQAMLATGSAINEVAQNSSAAESYLVDFTNRLSGVGNQAGISVSQLIGLGSVLDQNAQQVETSATALSGLIMKMYQEPAKFAKIAGLEVEQFSKLMKKDANEALLTLLDTLGKKGGLDQLAPIFKDMNLNGARASSILSVLAGNINGVRREQEIANNAFKEGTSVVNEYSVQNNTFSANLEKHKNTLLTYITDIGEKLAPMILEGASAGVQFMKVLSSMFSILIDNKTAVIAAGVGYITLTTAMKVNALWANRHIILTKTLTSLNVIFKGSLYALQVVFYTLTGQATKARGAMLAFGMVTKLTNPIGLVTAALTALGVALTYYIMKSEKASLVQKSLQNISKKTSDEYATQEAKLSILIKTLNNENVALNKRQEALNELKKIIPDYHADLTNEGVLINNNEDAIKNYLVQLEKQIKLKATQEELEEIYRKKRIQEKELIKKQEEAENANKSFIEISSSPMGSEAGVAAASLARRKQAIKKEAERDLEIAKQTIDVLNKEYQNLVSEISQSTILTENTNNNPEPEPDPEPISIQRKKVQEALKVLEEQHLKEMSALKQKYLSGDIETEEEYNQEILKLQEKSETERKAKLHDFLKSTKDSSLRIDIAKQIADIDAKTLDRQISQMEKAKKETAKALEEEAKTRRENALTEIDFLQKKEEQILAQQRAKKQITDEQYRIELLKNEEKFLTKRLNLNVLTEDEILKLKQQQEINKGEQDINKEEIRSSILDKYGLANLKTEKEAELALIKYYEEQGILSHDEALKAKAQADETYLAALTEKAALTYERIQMVGGNLSGMMTNFASAEENAVVRKYDKQIAAAEGNARKQKKLEEQKQKEQNAIKAKYADKQFAVSTAMTISSTAVAAMEAYKAMAGIPIVGPGLGAAAAAAAIAYGASQIAVAKEQRDAAKEGYFDGGFTGGTNPKEIRGYLPDGSPVHGKEFVGNRLSTANPNILPLYNIIDEAQRHGTAGSLTKADLAKALNVPTYRHSNPIEESKTNLSTNTYTQETNEYSRFIEVIEKLENRLNEKIIAKVSITGDDGLEETQNLYDKMKKNISR